MCDSKACVVNRCGPLCQSCVDEYRSDYVRYKSTRSACAQIELRSLFADKWFSGQYDDAHLWSKKKLAAPNRAPQFKFRAMGFAVKRHMQLNEACVKDPGNVHARDPVSDAMMSFRSRHVACAS